MTAYNESNFNSCLEAITAMRDQRNEAIRIAHRLLRVLQDETHPYDEECPCRSCDLGEQFEQLKKNVTKYQSKIQKK